MNPHDLSIALALAWATNITPCISGPPGGGKSSIGRQTANRTGRTHFTLNAGTKDPADFLGIPTFTDRGYTTWCPPEWWDQLPINHVILIDDIGLARPETQGALAEPILDRTINGKITLPPTLRFLLTTNRIEDRAGVHEMPTMMRNRIMFLDADTDLTSFFNFFDNPADLTSPLTLPTVPPQTSLHLSLRGFLRWKPDLLHAFNATHRSFPTPRSIESVNRLMPYFPHYPHLRAAMVSGLVGKAFASTFEGYLIEELAMCDPDIIIRDPLNAPIYPNRPALMHALCCRLADLTTTKTNNNIFLYISRPEIEQDLAALVYRDIHLRDPKLVKCPAGILWQSKNHHLLA